MVKKITLVGNNLTFEDDVQTTKRELDEVVKGSFSDHDTRHDIGGADAIGDLGNHSARHEETGADEVDPALHASKHEDSGADEVDITGLVGHQYGKNLIQNPSFESYNIDTNLPDKWTLLLTPTLAIAADTLFPARGGNQITITATGAGEEGIIILESATNYLKGLPSTKYFISFDYKVTAGDELYAIIRCYQGAVLKSTPVAATLTSTSAIRHTVVFTSHADTDNIRIEFLAKNDGDIVIVSHPKLEEGAIATPYILQDRERTCTRIEATNATPDPHIASRRNVHIITALGAAAAFQAPTGTPRDGDSLIFRLLDNSTARALTYNAIYRGISTSLPNTTTIDKTMYQGYLYNLADNKYDLVALAEES